MTPAQQREKILRDGYECIVLHALNCGLKKLAGMVAGVLAAADAIPDAPDRALAHKAALEAAAKAPGIADDKGQWDFAMSALKRTINLDANSMESIVDAILVAVDDYQRGVEKP